MNQCHRQQTITTEDMCLVGDMLVFMFNVWQNKNLSKMTRATNKKVAMLMYVCMIFPRALHMCIPITHAFLVVIDMFVAVAEAQANMKC